MARQDKGSLEEALVRAMEALDNQVAREMQRDPKAREAHGVQKWEPFSKRIEHIASLSIEAFAEQRVGLDSILILSQSFAKLLKIAVTELGEEGLGELRSNYCLQAFEAIQRDAEEGIASLRSNDLH